ncbi:MAG: PD40 domain-containing protein [Chloroflexi bacterium]|nr:PD40 domain-containing protein [Chloroflexota bacterium]
MMRLHRIGLLVLLCLLVIAGAARAQDQTSALIMLINGDFYAWREGDPAPQRLTTWGYNFRPALSPDGNFLAYMAWSPITVEAIRRSGGIAGGELPGDIRVFDLATGQEQVVAAQPEGASFFVEGTPDKAVMRSAPVWSPDGRRLAWTEFDYPGELTNRLVIHDLETGASQVIVPTLPAQGGVPSPMAVLWTDSGLVVRSITPRPDAPTYTEDFNFLVYNENGALLATVPVPRTDTEFMIDHLAVNFDGQEYIAALYNVGTWILLNPLTGDNIPAPGLLQLSAAAAPQGAVSALAFPPETGAPTNGRWDIVDSQGNPTGLSIPLNDVPSASQPAFSPDGQAVAYITGTTTQGVEVWRGGQAATVPPVEEDQLISAVVWSPLVWRIASSGEFGQEPVSAFNCPDALPPRLAVGSTGRVIAGSGPNNLRAEPFTTAQVVAEIPEGGEFTVVRGPDCGGDIIWWQVEYNGVTGWTAEGQGQDYFAEPGQ